MEEILIAFVAKYPVGAALLMGMGVFRLLFKPTMVYLHQVAAATPTKKDDEALKKFEAGPVYKALAFLADYLLSLKLPGAK